MHELGCKNGADLSKKHQAGHSRWGEDAVAQSTGTDGCAEDRKEISLVGVKDCVGDGHTVNNYSDLDYKRF